MRGRFLILIGGGVLAALLVAGGAAGLVGAWPGAQTPTPQRQDREQRINDFINRLAQNLGVSPERLRDALRQTAIQEIDAAQAAGRITAEQAQRLKDAVNSGNFGGFGLGRFPHLGGPDRRGLGGAGLRLGRSLEEIATFLGITPQQLREEWRTGTLAQVAQAHGKTRQQLQDFLLQGAQQRLAEAVGNGRITQAQADQMLATFRSMIDRLLDAQGPRGIGPRDAPGPRPGRSTN
jgi:hypothetical protein